MRIQTAKQKSMTDLLEALGHQPVKQVKGEYWYCSPLREEQDPSFKLSQDGKAWFDHGLGKGGNIIAFAQAYFQTQDLSAILREFDRLFPENASQISFLPTASPAPKIPLTREQSASASAKQKTDTQALSTSDDSIKPLANAALLHYLRGRGIEADLAARYVSEIYYKHREKSYFALAFANDAGGYELRNPYFKGNRGGKGVTTIVKPHHAPGEIILFEGFMDFLSYLTHRHLQAPPAPVIILNGVAQVKDAIATITRLGADTVHVYADRDASGQEILTILGDALPHCAILDQSSLYAGYDDFNAFLQAEQARASQPKTETAR